MPVQDDQRTQREQTARQEQEAHAQAKRREQEQQEKPAAVKSETLLPVLHTAHERHTHKQDALLIKKAQRLDKIAVQESKIHRLTEKADRLSATNDMLKALSAGTVFSEPIAAMIQQNQRRIEKIQNAAIPQCEDKIAAHRERLTVLNQKIAVQRSKADKCKALSGIITSFAVMNPEKRRAQFAESMDLLHGAAREHLRIRSEKIERKITVLEQRYAQADSAEQLRITRSLEALHTTHIDLAEKSKKLMPPTQNASYQALDAAQQDKLLEHAEQQLDTAAQNGENRMNALADDLCAEMGSELERTEAKARVAAMSPQEKQAFMNRADADRLHTPTPVEIAMFDLIAAEEAAAFQAEQQQAVGQALLSVEQSGVIRYYTFNGQSADDILAAANTDKPFLAVSALGSERISEAEFAEIQQSEAFTYSVSVDLDRKSAEVYTVNGGHGGIAEADRTEQNSSISTVALALQENVLEDTLPKKINPEYFKAIPRADRQIDIQPTAAAEKIMETLKQQGIPFSAVVRENGTALITVNKIQHGAVYQSAVHAAHGTVHQPQPAQIVKPEQAGMKIAEALNKAGIPCHVSRKDNSVIITADAQDAQKLSAIAAETEQQHRRQFINPEVFQQMPREERFTQRMSEAQARETVEKLAEQGVAHSAVLDGDRSAVTVEKKSKGFLLTRQKRQDIGRKAAKASKQQEKKNDPEQTQQQGIGD